MIASARALHIAIVRAAATVQGLALVVVPTVSTVLTDPKGLALSAASYGTLFLPQSMLAIAGSFAGAAVTRRFGARSTLIAGFAANALAMALMTASALPALGHIAAYVVLLCATSLLGVGFAFVTPTLNVLAATLEADARDRAVLIVNALLGGSAAAAPVLLIVFVKLGVWWGLPFVCAAGMTALIVGCTRVPFDNGSRPAASAKTQLPFRVLLFAAFAFAYGLCEQLNGSWALIYMTKHLGAAMTSGSVALAAFWAVATGARVGFASLGRTLPPSTVFCILPLVLAAAFAMLAVLPAHAPAVVGIAAFALAGLGISALLPLVLSFCERSIPKAATIATSVVFATYLLGYGVAAFGVGPLQDRGITLPAMDAVAIGLSGVIAALAIAIVKTSGEHS